MKKTIIIFGYGYVSKFLIQKLNALGWIIYCTSRKTDIGRPVKNENVTIINFFDPVMPSLIKSSDALLSTVPPNNEMIDPVLHAYADVISKNIFGWIGYLSSTNVYGDHRGSWIDETTPCNPSNQKARTRLEIERQWLHLYDLFKLPVHIFRLSGIYGPARNCLEDIIMGKDFTIVKKNHYFSRIHIKDICPLILSSIHYPTPGEIYNISDNEPAPLHVVQQFGAKIMGKEKLKEIMEEKSKISEDLKRFFMDNKKVNGQKIIKKLGVNLLYPHYRSGLLNGCLPFLQK